MTNAVDYINEKYKNEPYELFALTDDSVIIQSRMILVYRTPDGFAEIELSKIGKSITDLEKLLPTMVDPDNSMANDYLRGMANGALLAQSCFTDLEPNYIRADGTRDHDPRPEQE